MRGQGRLVLQFPAAHQGTREAGWGEGTWRDSRPYRAQSTCGTAVCPPRRWHADNKTGPGNVSTQTDCLTNAAQSNSLQSGSATTSTCGLVAMTSASHAEGRQLDPGQVYVPMAQVLLVSFFHARPLGLSALFQPYTASRPSAPTAAC